MKIFDKYMNFMNRFDVIHLLIFVVIELILLVVLIFAIVDKRTESQIINQENVVIENDEEKLVKMMTSEDLD